MLFNSVQFLLFLPVVLVLYARTARPLRPALLLLASHVFYMAFIPGYILVLWLLIGIDYAAGIMLETRSGPIREAILALSLASNLGILGFFKYWNFVAQNVNWALGAPHLPLQGFVLPIGLSFHTFQSLAYTIEVYRRHFPAERNLVRYALYVLFFPQMVAGPIERPAGLLRQIQDGAQVVPERVRQGLRLMLLGYAKKVVIADRLAVFVTDTYAHPTDFLGPRLWLATVFFSVQIYCDFSGYSDIARGLAQLLGYRLCINFRRPYAALGLSEFWRRWHVSLSTWFRDFVYIPMGGNRGGPARVARNLIVTFVVSGIWHGANWTFLIWGALHGLGVWFEHAVKRPLPPLLGWGLTWVWVTMCWVWFRAQDVGSACYILCGGAMGWNLGAASWRACLGANPQETLIDLVLAVAFLIYQVAAERGAGKPSEELLRSRPWAERQALYLLLMLAILFMGRFSRNDFIYFQF